MPGAVGPAQASRLAAQRPVVSWSLDDNRDDYAYVVELVRSKQRVADHGEVFTPAWMVEAMLDLVKDETERIDSRFLEPACGSGQLPRPGAAAQARRRRARVRQERLREAPLRAAWPDVHLRHRAAGRQHRRVPREHAGDLRRVPRRRRARRPVPSRRRRARRRTSSTATRSPCAPSAGRSRSRSPSGATWARASSSGATSASTRSRRCRPSVRGHALRRPRQARDLHADQELPAAHGRRSSRGVS